MCAHELSHHPVAQFGVFRVPPIQPTLSMSRCTPLCALSSQSSKLFVMVRGATTSRAPHQMLRTYTLPTPVYHSRGRWRKTSVPRTTARPASAPRPPSAPRPGHTRSFVVQHGARALPRGPLPTGGTQPLRAASFVRLLLPTLQDRNCSPPPLDSALKFNNDDAQSQAHVPVHNATMPYTAHTVRKECASWRASAQI